MVTYLYNSLGSEISNIVINDVTEKKISRTVVYDMPSVNKDIIQYMGNTNKIFTIKGWGIKTGSVALSTIREDLQYLLGATGSIKSDITSQTQVFYSDIEIEDRSGKPMEFSFSITAVEVI